MDGWLTPEEWQAVALSLRVSFWAVLVSLPLGVLVAYALARWNFWGRQLLNGLVHLPLILPPVVTSGSAWSSPFAGPGRRWRRG
jgi:molybdate transport system permease protein